MAWDMHVRRATSWSHTVCCFGGFEPIQITFLIPAWNSSHDFYGNMVLARQKPQTALDRQLIVDCFDAPAATFVSCKLHWSEWTNASHCP